MPIGQLTSGDIDEIVAAFTVLGWPGKDRTQYERYLDEQAAGDRVILVARTGGGEFAGYLTVKWVTEYAPFRSQGIPEIQDLNVLPHLRRQGLATALMDLAEEHEATRSPIAGIGVGLYADYGPAHLMYLKRGYRPDGRGVTYGGAICSPGDQVRVDDDLCLMMTRRLR
ncbi:GNAT family N-acetyltransferase [Actinoplanes sp. NPDC051470]|uniref:GNAT family N-acetyltransferase n=1 Tax=Actinoplanes sp. NPDC051470 TaxID=3157224 RepID=UPI00342BED95